MLDHYFRGNERKLGRWLRESPASPWLDGFARWLHSHGYRRGRGRRHLRAAAHLSRWAARRGTAVGELDEAALQAFRVHMARCRCFGRRRPVARVECAGAGRFVAYLRSISVVAAPAPTVLEPLVEGFVGWARRHRGVAESTLRLWTPLVADLVATVGTEPAVYNARSIRSFVLKRVETRSVSHANTVATVVRAFLRYLVAHGRIGAALMGAVPKVANWRLTSLPRYLSVEQVEQVVAACDPASPAGARDRAIILLLAQLGLRAGDVVALRLPDLDWSAGRIRLAGKTRQENWLPMPQEVGDAVLHYLRDSRPEVDDDHVFLTAIAPRKPLGASGTVSDVVTRALRRAAVDAPHFGAHLLRHSAATHLLRHGASLEAIAVVLRHRSLQSTVHYAKVHVELLRRVAQPWPAEEVNPC
jgi:integrase/recombinase XerD